MSTSATETDGAGNDAEARELAAVDKLVECLHNEIATIEGYDLALKHEVDPGVSQKLLELLNDHARRTELLRSRIQGRRATNVAAAASTVVAPAAEPTLEALGRFEDRALELCREGVALDEGSTRSFFEGVLLPAQERTHHMCRTLDRPVTSS